MKLYDISLPFSEKLPPFGGENRLTATETMRIRDGAKANVTAFIFGSHTGTHIDAPKHFLDDAATIADLPLSHFMGPALVVEVFGKSEVRAEDIAAIPGDISGKIILFHTDNADMMLDSAFHTVFASIGGDAAKALCDRGVKGVGIDYLSVDPYDLGEFPAHYSLLGAGMLVLEGIRLSGIAPGEYYLFAVPLLIPGGNGFPVRAFLMAFDDGIPAALLP